jgi:hypothetical protein
MLAAKLFSRDDGTSPLIGFNWSNSVNNETMELTAQFRKGLGFENVIRFEHHITETWKSIVKQPYDRRAELVELADHVANIAAKHEGGNPEIEMTLSHQSDILDYFREKKEVIDSGDWDACKKQLHGKGCRGKQYRLGIDRERIVVHRGAEFAQVNKASLKLGGSLRSGCLFV